jgi:hypothetical protein
VQIVALIDEAIPALAISLAGDRERKDRGLGGDGGQHASSMGRL